MWEAAKQQRLDQLRRSDPDQLTPADQQELHLLLDELDQQELTDLSPALAGYEQRQHLLRLELEQVRGDSVALAELNRRYADWLARARQQVGALLDEREALRAEYERVAQ